MITTMQSDARGALRRLDAEAGNHVGRRVGNT
jgi:hypothetical protein